MQLRHSFSPPDNSRLAHLCGSLDEHLRTIEAAFNVTLSRRGEHFRIEGARGVPQQVVELLESLYAQCARPLSAEMVQLAITSVLAARQRTLQPKRGSASEAAPPLPDEGTDGPTLHTRRADLQGRTPNQVSYLRQVLGHDLTFGIGPAGTGKTFLAVACAVDALERSSVQRIILTRPAVEAGERLGFLPGDLTQKVDPYLRPLYDALYDLMGFDRVTKAFEKGLIEIAPLAFMRGRTLNHAFIILDEAQNTTPEQMKMFLTRIGFGSRAVVTGDVSQIDLPRGARSGLIEAERILKRVNGVAFTRFTSADVVRHRPTRCRCARLRPAHPMKPTLSLSLQFADKRHRDQLPRHKVARWLKAAQESDAELTVRMVDAEEGQALNRDYRQKDYATNVLTFDYTQEPVVMADLILCAPVIEREAQEQNKALVAHYAHMLVHGALHAQGWDHLEDDEAQAMEQREREILAALGFDDPYAPN